MIVEFLLVAICMLDASFCGFRDAAGRNKLIRKWSYFRRAIAIGTAGGLVLVGLIGASVAYGVQTAADSEAMYAHYVAAGAIMLRVYVPFTALVLIALAVYTSRKPHIKALATVTVLGPLTVLRPFAIAGGAVWAMIAEPHPPIITSLCIAIVVVAPYGRYLAMLGVNRLSLERMIALESHTRVSGT